MKYALLIVALLFGCDEDKPDKPSVIAAKAECKKLIGHIADITPQAKGRTEEIVANLSIEDQQACVASAPEIRACMMGAADVDGVKKCIPSNDILDCMNKADKARDKERGAKKVDDVDATVDAPFDAIRKKCYAGDKDAAKDLKVD
ncbi:MAG: hypothetical protein QM831_17855 [Kofleriaceae bacterium]